MDVLTIIGYALGVGGAVLILTSKVKSDNLADLKERVGILEKEREEAREQHLENQKAIANLEGQLATYKEIPLKSIAETLLELKTSNQNIYDTLRGSAKIAKDASEDGGLLVKTKPTNPLMVQTKESKPLDVKKPK